MFERVKGELGGAIAEDDHAPLVPNDRSDWMNIFCRGRTIFAKVAILFLYLKTITI